MNIADLKNISVLSREGKSVETAEWKVTCKISTEDTEGKFSAVIFNFKKGFQFAMNKHTKYDKFCYLINGKIDICENGKSVIAEPGYINYLPKNTPHKLDCLEESEILMVYMPGGLEKMIFELGDLTNSGNLDENSVKELLARFGSEICE